MAYKIPINRGNKYSKEIAEFILNSQGLLIPNSKDY